MKKILHVGGFDADNFGDLLFPIVAEYEVPWSLIHLSPTGNSTPWVDAVRSYPFVEGSTYSDVQGVILGGGHLIRSGPTLVEPYKRRHELSELAYTAFWVFPAWLARRFNVPLVWNAPGVPRLFLPELEDLVRWACSAVGYVSVRDCASKTILTRAGVCPDTVHVVPDSVAGINPALHPEFGPNGLARRLEWGRREKLEARFAIFHVKQRYLNLKYDELVDLIDTIGRHFSVRPIVVALGPCHGDTAVANEIRKRAGHRFLYLLRPTSIREVCALIIRAEFYCGSSLHGYIVARSYGRPGVIVADEQKAGFQKYTGYLAQTSEQGNLAKSWRDALGILSAIDLDESGPPQAITDSSKKHWAALIESLAGSVAPRPRPPKLSRSSQEVLRRVVLEFGGATK